MQRRTGRTESLTKVPGDDLCHSRQVLGQEPPGEAPPQDPGPQNLQKLDRRRGFLGRPRSHYDWNRAPRQMGSSNHDQHLRQTHPSSTKIARFLGIAEEIWRHWCRDHLP